MNCTKQNAGCLNGPICYSIIYGTVKYTMIFNLLFMCNKFILHTKCTMLAIMHAASPVTHCFPESWRVMSTLLVSYAGTACLLWLLGNMPFSLEEWACLLHRT